MFGRCCRTIFCRFTRYPQILLTIHHFLFYFSFIMDFRKQHLDAFVKKYGIKFGFMSAFCKATAYALQDQPVVNAVIEENVRFF